MVVLDRFDKVIGMAEYLRERLNVITSSSVLLESIFRVDYEGIIIIDKEGYILRVNPAAEKMFQLNFFDVNGKNLSEVLPGQIIQLEHEPSASFSSYRSSLVDFEKEMLLDVLKKTNGNRSAAARLLNLSRSAFYDRLAKYNLK